MRARTSFKYEVEVREDYNYEEKRFEKVRDRSAYLTITADTEEECIELMDDFQGYISEKSDYKVWDGDSEVEQNEKNNKFVISTQMNIMDRDEFEYYKELYKEWRELLRKNPTSTENNKVDNNVTEVWEEIKLKPGIVVKNNNGYSYKVLAQQGDYTLLQALEKNRINRIETIVAYVIKQSNVSKHISWLKGTYYMDEERAREVYNKKL